MNINTSESPYSCISKTYPTSLHNGPHRRGPPIWHSVLQRTFEPEAPVQNATGPVWNGLPATEQLQAVLGFPPTPPPPPPPPCPFRSSSRSHQCLSQHCLSQHRYHPLHQSQHGHLLRPTIVPVVFHCRLSDTTVLLQSCSGFVLPCM